MSIEYAVADCDAPVIQYIFTFPTVERAPRAACLGDYVIAVEDGRVRPLNGEEKAKLPKGV